MDFSDIRTIIIGEAGEYGKRLVRYLEIHLSSAVRVYHFTTAEGMVSFKEEAEIYLLDERFFKELSEEKQKFLKQKKLILLTWREEQGSFCKYDNPQKLLDMLSDFTDYNSDLSDLAAELKDTPTKLTIVYSPVYDEYKDYLKLFLLTKGNSRTVCYRMMDIMQENIASKEPGFLMENCLFSYSWKGSLAAGGVKLNFVKQCSY